MDVAAAPGVAGGDVFGSSTAPLTWHDFLERMRQPSAADFVKSIKGFIVSFSNNAPDPETDSASVQEFLSNMEVAFRAHSLWAGCSEEELESAGEGLEKYVMTKLYSRAFASVPEDVNRDEEVHEKMSLVQQFIRPENLDIKPIFQNETSWLLAQKELQKINMYKAPRDKLVCILNCCKVINNLLINASLASTDNPPGADEFLPVLIYVTIKANPPQLHSNLLYIQRYRHQSRLVSEAAYYFTNILSAESFIWNIDANSLSMDEVEFQRNVESAKAVLQGLSTDADGRTIQTTHDVPELQGQKAEQIKAKESTRILPTEVQQLPPLADDRQKVEDRKKSVNERSSISDLETKGAAELLKDDQLSRYFHEYPFLYARAGDLTINDVECLLDSYKRLVLKYVALAKGLGADNNFNILPSTQKTSETENAKENDNAKDSEASNDRFGEFCKAAESSNADSSLEVEGTSNLPVAESA